MRLAFLLALIGLWVPGARLSLAESFRSWSAKAEKASRRGDSTAAIEAYSSALRLWKKGDGVKAKAKALAGRAAAHEKDGDLEKALGDISAALAADKRNPSYYHRRGGLYLRLVKPSEAVGDFYQAVALDFNFKEAYFDRALAYEALGDLKFAREDLKTACSLGLKKACSRRLAAKAAPAPETAPRPEPPSSAPPKPPAPAKALALPASEEGASEPAMTEPAASRAAAVSAAPAEAPKPAAAPKPDFGACLAALDSCLKQEVSFSACVNRAPACGSTPQRGCCPRACLETFEDLLKQDRSEAAAFREVFAPRHPCAQPAPEAAR